MEILNNLSYAVIGAAFNVHKELGPGLLESTYEVCLFHEILAMGYKVEKQKPLPVKYKNISLDAGYRIDLLVEDNLILELKAVDEISPIHKAQLMTYLKLSKVKLGLLLNFNVQDMKTGIHRFIM